MCEVCYYQLTNPSSRKEPRRIRFPDNFLRYHSLCYNTHLFESGDLGRQFYTVGSYWATQCYLLWLEGFQIVEEGGFSLLSAELMLCVSLFMSLATSCVQECRSLRSLQHLLPFDTKKHSLVPAFYFAGSPSHLVTSPLLPHAPQCQLRIR